ncbi:MAG: carboxypeptidase regulatory-like domain-containing protein [Deltaproteobacteria bacterium]|nr:carboxypeptidase regulatory-like domain-containing protein [Deltaproteobacteria bacterium]
MGVILGWAVLVAGPALAQAPAAGGALAGEVAAKPAKYREHVVVSVEKVPGAFRPPAQPAQYDQRGMQFIPHVMAVVRGTTVKFLNNDNVSHNVFTPDGDKYNLGTWGQGQSQTRVFPRSGVYRQLCNVHPEMEGFIVVLDNPYFAVTGADGRFRIENIPPGTYTVRAWSEKLAGATQQVTITAGGAATARFELKKP